MTYCRDSEVCIWWALYDPMRPYRRIYKWQWRNATDASWSRSNYNIASTSRLHSYYTHSCDVEKAMLFMESWSNLLFKRAPIQERMQIQTQPMSCLLLGSGHTLDVCMTETSRCSFTNVTHRNRYHYYIQIIIYIINQNISQWTKTSNSCSSAKTQVWLLGQALCLL